VMPNVLMKAEARASRRRIGSSLLLCVWGVCVGVKQRQPHLPERRRIQLLSPGCWQRGCGCLLCGFAATTLE
jgi:hypothetical protein